MKITNKKLVFFSRKFIIITLIRVFTLKIILRILN